MSGKVRVLLVEDNTGDSRLVEELLNENVNHEFEVINVTRLAEGIKELMTSIYEVILLDLGLPDSQGFTTYEELYKYSKSIPIIILTGFDDIDFASEAVSKGAQDYLVKANLTSLKLSTSICYGIERKKYEQKLKHLNSVLEAIRGVNQLITKEDDIDSLINQVCYKITRTRGYKHVWLALIDENGE